ncbi:MarR family winged helix-turn-helix transcriptional regulator [Staphylococcus durrellii]|uniref:MarR family winged helix-turn-helix transcriptional regulator n=1 Tax=Staphylococcus durrellii TaxID=2781773 RepID=UPI00189EA12C|nr:MarR family transcriptional regulator [Staphylococcus durrellii]MBF7017365.1 MarR family transcriptional regulator [Staphylococcus durrellii]
MEKNCEEDIASLVRGLGTRIVLYQQHVSEILNVYSHDFTTIDILRETGPITAGELAQKVGLSTGSVTSLIDRLEKRGYLIREKHPKDRRKVIIVPRYEEKKEVQNVFSELNKNMLNLSANYNEKELAIVKRFLNEVTSVIENQIIGSNSEEIEK